VGVNRRRDGRGAGLHVGEEAHEAAHVVALGEALAVHEPARFELPVREEEAVGGDQVHLRMVGPAPEELLQDAGRRALADRDAAGDREHVRDLGRRAAEERVGDPVQVLRGGNVEVQQS
jgi:hypothetical protein